MESDGLLKTGNGAVHAEHEERIVKVVEGWVEELEGRLRGGNAAGKKEFSERFGNSSLGSELSSFLRVLRSQLPALRNGGRGSCSGFCGVAHRSSGPSSGSSMMMSLRPSMFSTSSW